MEGYANGFVVSWYKGSARNEYRMYGMNNAQINAIVRSVYFFKKSLEWKDIYFRIRKKEKKIYSRNNDDDLFL